MTYFMLNWVNFPKITQVNSESDKGVKAKNSFDKRQFVIFHYKKDKSYWEIGKLINLSKSTR